MEKIGNLAFIAGVVLCFVAAFFWHNSVLAILTALGLVVGYLNIEHREAQTFLFVALAVIVVSAFAAPQFRTVPEIGAVLGRIFSALLFFMAPAATLVGLKTLFTLARK